MREPGFWHRRAGAAAAALAPLAGAYGAVAAARLRRTGAVAPVPVLCVGSPTLGGAGKTPAALALGRILRAAGHRVAFLSRGYGGRLEGPVAVEPARHGAADVGDEPLLLAREAETFVARDRVQGAAAAAAAGASVVVMDDGFQNPSLAKDFALLVVDAERGIGNGRVFPAGPLRAPIGAQLARAQALLVIGQGEAGAEVATAAASRGLPVFRGALVPSAADVAVLRQRPVLAFAGIGAPQKFFATLAAAGIVVGESRIFADHHRYRERDARALLELARARALVPVTTEKDMVRLGGDGALAALAALARPLPVTLAVEPAPAFADLIRQAAAGR